MRGSCGGIRGALLGLLLERPGHAGDLSARLEARLGDTWCLDSHDIPRLLEQLVRLGLAEPRSVPVAGRRGGRVVYYPALAASGALGAWMESASPREVVRLTVLAKVAVARPQDVPALLGVLRRHEAECLTLAQGFAAGRSDPVGWRELCMEGVRELTSLRLAAEIEWAARTRRRFAGWDLDGGGPARRVAPVAGEPEREGSGGQLEASDGGLGVRRETRVWAC